jgi:DNA polymerase II large subunit
MPITHFKPKEIGTSIEKLKELGYENDITGKPLEHDDQVLEIRPQDIILPNFRSLELSCGQVLLAVGKFIDDLLVQLYGLEPYYCFTSEKDLIGHLVIGLAPHISAGLIGRIIGFSETQTLLAHPLWHAGLRRDCDGDEAAVMLLLDALLNFSRQYLPERRGAKTMDSPLVLTALIDPGEVDDQVHGIDVVWRYPRELYEAALEYKNPWDVQVEQLKHRLGTEKQFIDFGFSHYVTNFNNSVRCSSYKLLPTMQEKLEGQMELARKIRAVDKEDVARLVIEKHLIRDIKGNVRKFSTQKFRCVKCNAKYRRPPLQGMCTECNGYLLFTISEGSATKYLPLTLDLTEKYDFSPYLKQNLEILSMNITAIFGREKEKQTALKTWF